MSGRKWRRWQAVTRFLFSIMVGLGVALTVTDSIQSVVFLTMFFGFLWDDYMERGL